MKTVGTAGMVNVIGVGNMGGAMAARLLSRGWSVAVADLDAEKVASLEHFGAVAQANHGGGAINSVATIIAVVTAEQTRELLFGETGLASQLPAGHTVILCPTMAPGDVESIAFQLAERGIDAIDAPMSGGPARARNGTMSLMVACAPGVFERHAALLQTLSNKIFRISDLLGDAARTKLVNNLLAGINLVGAAEALALAGRLGLDLSKTLNVIEQSSGQSWVSSDRMRRAIAGDYAPRAHLTLLEKDTGLALACAAAAGIVGPLGAHAHRVFADAHAAGMAALDDAAVFKFLSDQ